ncbi:MAG: SDR family oxidoreductase [Crocinitomicaceae bacterium]|nr:SDR family oxidoreductase [Crocinitomicaceae bacterium]
MSNIFISGDTGFLGKELKVNLSKKHNIFTSTKRIQEASYWDEIDGNEIDVFIHLAGKSYVPKSWENPSEFYTVNACGTVMVCEFCVKNNIKLIFVSSYVYGAPDYLPVDEKHPLKAPNPYAFSKISAEESIRFFAEKFDLEYNILRPFNIYGPGQSEEFLIPTILKQIQNGGPIKIKDLTPKRDFIYLSDVTSAIECSLNVFNNTEYNIAFGSSFSVKDIIDISQEIYGTNFEVKNAEEVRPNEIPDCYSDISKFKKAFSWEPKYDLKKGISAIKKALNAI